MSACDFLLSSPCSPWLEMLSVFALLCAVVGITTSVKVTLPTITCNEGCLYPVSLMFFISNSSRPSCNKRRFVFCFSEGVSPWSHAPFTYCAEHTCRFVSGESHIYWIIPIIVRYSGSWVIMWRANYIMTSWVPCAERSSNKLNSSYQNKRHFHRIISSSLFSGRQFAPRWKRARVLLASVLNSSRSMKLPLTTTLSFQKS